MSTAFNISKGKIQWYWEQARTGTGGLIVMLLKNTGLQADGTLADHDDVAALLATTNDEADFTNYVRKTVAGNTASGPAAPTIDDTNNRALLDLPDQTWTDAGGAANNTLGKLLIAFDDNTGTGTDANLIPLLAHDITATTDGNDLIVRFHADGAARVA